MQKICLEIRLLPSYLACCRLACLKWLIFQIGMQRYYIIGLETTGEGDAKWNPAQ